MVSGLHGLSSAPLEPKRIMAFGQAIAELPPISPKTADDATLDEYLNALYRQGRECHTPNISPANTVFLQNILHQRRPQNILEVGTANGYSTLRFWQIVRAWHARITTLEVSTPNIIEASHHFAVTGGDAAIEMQFGNALTLMPKLPPHSFDFIFIDARKIYTLDFFTRARALATDDALIIIDDVLKFKDKMQNFYAYLERERVVYRIEQIDDDEDGVMLIDLQNH